MIGEIRIIGGLYKGKKIKVLNVDDLRPTSNRLRESLFNVLQFDIKGAKCLDAFAGSGALGIEALSRGAEETIFIEKDLKAYQQLQKTLQGLKTTHAKLIHQDTCAFLESCQQKFDVIFIDPPFQLDLWKECIERITQKQLLNPQGLIYLESPSPIHLNPEEWSVRKHNKMGDVYYAIYEILHTKS